MNAHPDLLTLLSEHQDGDAAVAFQQADLLWSLLTVLLVFMGVAAPSVAIRAGAQSPAPPPPAAHHLYIGMDDRLHDRLPAGPTITLDGLGRNLVDERNAVSASIPVLIHHGADTRGATIYAVTRTVVEAGCEPVLVLSSTPREEL